MIIVMGWFRMPYTKEQELLERSQAMIVADGSRKITKKEFYDEAIIYDEETEYPWYELFDEDPEPIDFPLTRFHNMITSIGSSLGLFEANHTPGREIVMLFEPHTEFYVDFQWRSNKIIVINNGNNKIIENISSYSIDKLKNKILCMK